MVEVLIYFSLISFWLDWCAGFQLEELFDLTMGLSLQNIFMYILILVWGLTIKTRDNLFQKNNVNRLMFIMIYYMVVLIILNVSGFGGEKASLKQEIVQFKIFLNPWIFFLLITSTVKDKRTCDRLISALKMFYIATVFLVLIQIYAGFDLGANITLEKTDTYEDRFQGFSAPAEYATYLVLFIPLFLSSIIFSEDRVTKTKGFIFLLIGLIGLLLTISKGGFIALFFSIGYFLFYVYRKKVIDRRKVLIFIFLLPIIITVSYTLLPSNVKERIQERVTLKIPVEERFNPWAIERSLLERITSGRTKIWMHSLKLIAKKPIFGYGKTIASTRVPRSTHNDYLGWLLNYGIIGFLLLGMIYIQIIRHVKYYLKTSTNPKSRILYFSYFCGFVGYTAAMFGIHLVQPRMIFWIYTSIIYKYAQLDNVKK